MSTPSLALHDKVVQGGALLDASQIILVESDHRAEVVDTVSGIDNARKFYIFFPVHVFIEGNPLAKMLVTEVTRLLVHVGLDDGCAIRSKFGWMGQDVADEVYDTCGFEMNLNEEGCVVRDYHNLVTLVVGGLDELTHARID